MFISQWPGPEPPRGAHASNAALVAELAAWGFAVEPETTTTQEGSAVSVLRASVPADHTPGDDPSP